MDYLVEEYTDNSLRLLIRETELEKNGYDVWACVGNPPLLDAFMSRLISQLISEDGLVLNPEAKARVYIACDTLIIAFAPDMAHFKPLEEYKTSDEYQEESGECTDNVTVFSIRGDLDSLMEISHVLKRQGTDIKESVLYKDQNSYQLEFTMDDQSPSADIGQVLSDYMVDVRHYDMSGRLHLIYGNEHKEAIIREDAVTKLDKAWTAGREDTGYDKVTDGC